MKIVTYNIRYGLGLDGHYDLERIAESVCSADIIALQEVERFWRRSAMSDQPEILASLLREYYWAYCPAYDMDASVKRDDGSVRNRRRQFGPMLLSRWPIISSRIFILPKLATLEHFNMDMGGLECVIAAPCGPLRIFSVHLSANSVRERLLQIDYLLALHRTATSRGGSWTGIGASQDPLELENYRAMDWSNGESPPPMPIDAIMMGDFNSLPESAEYVRITGDVDSSFGRVSYQDSFVDSWNVAREHLSENALSWWPDPPNRSPGYGLRLDYCFLSPAYASKVDRAWVDYAAKGSDHRPYWVELSKELDTS